MGRSQYIMTNNPHVDWHREFEDYLDEKMKTDRRKYTNYSDIPKNLRGKIKQVLFKDPATIVFWTDGTKTVVKADGDIYDPEKGLAMAIAKKALGNQGNYYNEFKKWLPEEEDVEPLYPSIVIGDTGAKLADIINERMDDIKKALKGGLKND